MALTLTSWPKYDISAVEVKKEAIVVLQVQGKKKASVPCPEMLVDKDTLKSAVLRVEKLGDFFKAMI